MSQADVLLEHLERGETITPYSALQIAGSLACHSVMAELRSRGYNIVCTVKRNGRKRWGEYRLLPKECAPKVDTLTMDMFEAR